MTNPFSVFINAVDPLIRNSQDPSKTVAAIEPHLRELVQQRGWLGAPYRCAIPSKAYAQYLLYRPPGQEFSVVSFVWNSSQGSPVHDHCTWGVIGQYEGEEEETRFHLTSHGLEVAATVVARPGDVAHVYPPKRDIHRIFNRTANPTISIHIYGGDIGSQQRHAFDLDTGAARPFVSGYDLPVLE